MPQSSWAETAGQAKPIRGPRFGIGIQRHPHDIHDHTTSVNCRWKRQELQMVRETREVQSFVAAQAAHKRDARSERVVGLHATNLETSAEAARERWGEARGALQATESRLAREVADATGVNTTQAMTLLERHGWSLEAAVRGFTLSGNPGLQNPLRAIPDAGTALTPTGSLDAWHPHMRTAAPVVADGCTRCQFTEQAMPAFRVSGELDPVRVAPDSAPACGSCAAPLSRLLRVFL